jgi:hypothetical protein
LHLYVQSTGGAHSIEGMLVRSVSDFIILVSVTGKAGLEESFIGAFVDAIGCDGELGAQKRSVEGNGVLEQVLKLGLSFDFGIQLSLVNLVLIL